MCGPLRPRSSTTAPRSSSRRKRSRCAPAPVQAWQPPAPEHSVLNNRTRAPATAPPSVRAQDCVQRQQLHAQRNCCAAEPLGGGDGAGERVSAQDGGGPVARLHGAQPPGGAGGRGRSAGARRARERCRRASAAPPRPRLTGRPVTEALAGGRALQLLVAVAAAADRQACWPVWLAGNAAAAAADGHACWPVWHAAGLCRWGTPQQQEQTRRSFTCLQV